MTMEVYESMTQQDYQSDLPGYYENSTCATEYGGVRRQKHARSPGLNIQPGEILKVSSRRFARGRWVVGHLQRRQPALCFWLLCAFSA